MNLISLNFRDWVRHLGQARNKSDGLQPLASIFLGDRSGEEGNS